MKNIVAFIGRAGSGKDYQCNLLQEKGYVKLAFADALRRITFIALGYDYKWAMEHYEELKKTEIVNGLNLRQIMEKLGTEGIRYYENNFWTNCVLKELPKHDNVCISDMRFVNEFWGIYHWAKENSYNFKVIFCDFKSKRYQVNNMHPSAMLANYFALKGFKDLQEINYKDIEEYQLNIGT